MSEANNNQLPGGRFDLQTPKDLSIRFKVSESTVLRMAYSGDLPYISLRRGKRKKIIRFDPTAVDKWLAKRTLKSV